jgi:hypothetical protein
MSDEEQTTERFFPQISEEELWKFQVVKRQLEADPAYFEDPSCPYGGEVRRFFTGIRDRQESQQPGEEVDETTLEDEANRLYRELKDYGNKLDPEDTSEHNTYFRLSVSLLEKIISLKERAAGVKKVNEFTRTVLNIMEDELSPDQRTAITQRLRDLIQGE